MIPKMPVPMPPHNIGLAHGDFLLRRLCRLDVRVVLLPEVALSPGFDSDLGCMAGADVAALLRRIFPA